LPVKKETQSLIIRIEETVRETLNQTRFLHSRNTALLAVDLCRRFGLDPSAGYLAGIAHDLCKQLDFKQMLKLVKSDGRRISALEKDKPGLLHGRAAAVLLRERFCIHNKDILEAVALHTSGSENMCPLAKVIYIADKVEVSRNVDLSLRKMCCENELDDILFAVLKKTISKLQSKDLALSAETKKLLEKMKGKNN
jgi:nicotinate-nucleotide adenylyltransferase